MASVILITGPRVETLEPTSLEQTFLAIFVQFNNILHDIKDKISENSRYFAWQRASNVKLFPIHNVNKDIEQLCHQPDGFSGGSRISQKGAPNP